jgi:AcrR family transcriptional regulator
MSVSPQRKDAARNREAILDAARELMARSSDFPMYEVARRAGVGQATLYRHFRDRAELAAAIAGELHDEIAAMAAAGTLEDVLDAIVGCAVRSHGLLDLVRESPDAWREMLRLRDELIALVQRPLADAQSAGEVRADVEPADLFLVLTMIDGSVQGVTDPARRRETAQRARALVVRGLR